MKLIFYFFILFFNLLYGYTYKIVPIGDSITFGASLNPSPDSLKHSYRNYLWYNIHKKYNIDFVGTRKSGWAIIPRFDPDNEGYPGWTSFDISKIIYKKLVILKPNIILLHIGTNDILIPGNQDNPSMEGMIKILDEIDKFENNYHHHIKVIISTIIDMTYHPPFINKYNDKLKKLVNDRILKGDDLLLVDMQHNANLIYNATDFQDPIHPNNNGYKKMANVWLKALNTFIDGYLLPQVPKNFRASYISTKEIVLQWNDTKYEDGYKIYLNSNELIKLKKNTTYYKIVGLKPREKYKIKIISYNKERGVSKPAIITVKTKDDYSWLPAIINLFL